MVRVKICGITSVEDASFAAAMGADALGFVFASSPRQMSLDKALEIIRSLPPFVQTVGVFVDADIEEVIFFRNRLRLDLVQLSGSETDAYIRALGSRVIKTVHVANGFKPAPDIFTSATILLDTAAHGLQGGTGKAFDWDLAGDVAIKRPVILAGGLTPDNVATAVKRVQPYAVDVSSGVEIEPGRKDHDKIRRQ
ncbi:MAG: phosphoribosylanthranilate isomerase [Deltaproteobacteria bacterium]|nr:phosphoribosylanthranilate isomerase [Deltaproteobacteria bacterium]